MKYHCSSFRIISLFKLAYLYNLIKEYILGGGEEKYINKNKSRNDRGHRISRHVPSNICDNYIFKKLKEDCLH